MYYLQSIYTTLGFLLTVTGGSVRKHGVLRMGNEVPKLLEPLAFHTMELEVKGQNGGRAACSHPANHPSNAARWCPLSRRSQRVLAPLGNRKLLKYFCHLKQTSPRAQVAWDTGGDRISGASGERVRVILRGTTSAEPWQCRPSDSCCVAMCGSPSYRHFYRR